MPTLHLTAENVNGLKLAEAGQVIYRDTRLEGFGLRVGTSSAAYFVEKRVAGRNVRHTLGKRGQLTADQARKKAVIKLGEMTAGADPNAARKLERETAAAERGAWSSDRSLKALCKWYQKHLASLGKQSATDAKGIFARYVDKSEFAAVPAKAFTSKQATALIRRVVEAGHKRTAAKLRSYLRAAYALGQGAETNPQAPADLVLFGIEANPIASTAAIKNASGTRQITLTEEELGETVKLLRERRAAKYDDALAAVELSLWLGGQRLAQVLRLTPGDVDRKAERLVLLDGKGRREQARRHLLPITPEAMPLVEQILDMRRGDWLFGDGEVKTSPDTVARKGVELLAAVQANVAAAREKRGEKVEVRPKLEPRDLRRTAETMLAAMGVSKDIRAQLLSHGLGGVQGRHYDQHDYLAEKRAALVAWAGRLSALADDKPQPANVRRLVKRAAR